MAQLTQRQLLQLLKNREYWREREAQQRATYIRTEEEELKEVNRIYDEMYAWAVKEVDAFYGKYATAEGIDITEAKKRVSQLDIEEYERLAKEYVKDRNFSDQANAEMRLYNATMKINRLELLKAQIGLHLVNGFDEIDKHYEKLATDRATQELERMSGILGNTLTETETAKTARQIVNADFYNATFSERIWSAHDYLKDAIATELQKGFIAGVGSREMARRLKEYTFDKSYSDALRLARTELRRIQTDVAKDNYERNGIEEYEFLAVNPNACPICRKMDGDIYKVRDMEAGLNAPPIHPNCHCTTAPHFDDTEYEAWLNYLEQGGTTDDWNKMSPTERQKWLDNVVQSTPKATDDITTRAEAEQALFDMGFEYIEDSFNKLPDDVVVAQVKQLKRLEDRFGCIGKSANPTISGRNEGLGTEACVTYSPIDPKKQKLVLCSWHYRSLDYMKSEVERQTASKWSMPCGEKYKGVYPTTHEYGHMLHNILLSQEADSFETFTTKATTFEGRIKSYGNYCNKLIKAWDKEIQAIAKENNPDFSARDNISRYGMTNASEFFAEVFANSQCGDPNELGKAMQTWLERKGL